MKDGLDTVRHGCGLVTGVRRLLWVEGPDAVDFLDGLLSQDVAAMASGGVARSFLLSPQGKLRAVLWLLRDEARVGLVTDGDADTVASDLARFKLRVEAEIGDPLPLLELWGPAASAVVEQATQAPAPAGWAEHGGALTAAIPLGTLPRFVLAGMAAGPLMAAGAAPVDHAAVDAVRVEVGEPMMGVDIDENTIPQESGLVPAAVSFTKGCYLGQELVARIDSRGHVNRHLRGLAIAGPELPPVGAAVLVGDRDVGALTSVADAGEGMQALALLRREVMPGDEVAVRWNGGETTGSVRELPILTTA